jgi:hypothetical protein
LDPEQYFSRYFSRNRNYTFLKGYAGKIGYCDVFYAEMWGMYIGMDLAQRQWITHF